ncbi:3-phosphoshikimate 1-carboxyvinyltransferase [Egibacter rhizosphaerae]|uniref:3-phosphoshikimate 1-carboxyvinyltransferase n=1 Tax=Egibacter rhizosphaerae TaxID=1670831 RepID=UPI0013F1545F|nr:3-phosphoshikimate 1-carboxyvinyltransferase [Egibacter rhizosphaerae]
MSVEPEAVPRAAVALSPAGAVAGAVRAPASKSVTNRLLPIAALARGTSTLLAPLESDDSRAMRDAVCLLGAQVLADPEPDGTPRWHVTGTSGALRGVAGPLDAGLSGTSMRFLAALAPLADGPVTVDGEPPLRRRPVGPLTAALAQLGASVHDDDGYPPVTSAGGGLVGGDVTIDVRDSSQFATAVLLAAPYAREGVTVRLAGEAAVAYIVLTVEAMRAWGAQVTDLADGWRVTAGTGYRARSVEVEYDASAAVHLFSLAAATGGTVTVTNVPSRTSQPDAAVVDLLAAMGCRTARDGDRLSVTGPERLRPLDADLSAHPDQITTLAALAAITSGTSHLSGVGVARHHETDRLAALATELGKLGVRVVEEPDGLVIEGGAAAGPARLATHDDHRLAMAFAAIGAAVGGVVVEEPWCVTKTYPGFWRDAAALGVHWEEEP